VWCVILFVYIALYIFVAVDSKVRFQQSVTAIETAAMEAMSCIVYGPSFLPTNELDQGTGMFILFFVSL